MDDLRERDPLYLRPSDFIPYLGWRHYQERTHDIIGDDDEPRVNRRNLALAAYNILPLVAGGVYMAIEGLSALINR